MRGVPRCAITAIPSIDPDATHAEPPYRTSAWEQAVRSKHALSEQVFSRLTDQGTPDRIAGIVLGPSPRMRSSGPFSPEPPLTCSWHS